MCSLIMSLVHLSEQLYLMYMYFLGHTDRLITEMDMHSQRLVDAISAEGLQEHDSSRGRTRSRKAA